MPIRIQRRRTKGWKMPENTVYVGRGSKWGNPYTIINEEGFPLVVSSRGDDCPSFRGWQEARQGVVHLYRERCLDGMRIEALHGKNLACWCPATDEFGAPFPCHADVLLELANK